MAGKGLPLPHEQCESLRRNGKRCRKYKLRGSRTCEFHGGRTAQKNPVRVHHLPRFYSKVLTKTLADFVAECADIDPTERLGLMEELDLMRHAAMLPISLYNQAVENGKHAVIEIAASGMKQALNDLANMAERIVRMDAARKDKISVHTIEYVVNQIVRIMYEKLDEDEAKEIEATIRSKVKLPKSGVDGTSITPDQDALDMDDTIPKEPE